MPDSATTLYTDIMISELPTAPAANATDQLEANQAGITRSITLDQVSTVVAGSSQIQAEIDAAIGAPDWGDITGKPATFPPTVPIAQADVTSLVADLALKAPLASPVFTGDARAVTPPLGDVDTSIATTEWVTGEISAIPPTAATVTGFWNYNSAALVPPPASGRVRISVAWPPTIGASIHFYIAATDVDGFAYTWSLGPNVGDLFVFKSASGGRLTGTVTARTIAAYLDVTVLVSAVSGNNVNNSRCQISSVAAGGGGGGAPSGPAGGDLAGTYPNPTVNPEVIDDRVAALLVAGANVTLSYNDAAGSLTIASTAAGGGGGTVTSTSVVSANGLAGTVASPTTTPAITLTTTVTGMVKGNGTALSAATAGTDYMTPGNVSAAYQPLDSGLTALSSIATGIVANTAADAFAARTITGTASRVTVTNGNGVSGNPTLDISATYDALWQPVDADLTALAALTTTGMMARSAANTYTMRTITGTTNRVTVSNGDGIAGNPTLDISATYDALWQPKDADLTALAGLDATAGLVEQTGAAAFTKRALGVAASTSVPTRADADTRYLPAVSTTAPGSPIDNQLWFYSDNAIGGGQLFLRYNDGAGASQWVPASPAIGTAPAVQTIMLYLSATSGGVSGVTLDVGWDVTAYNTTGGTYSSGVFTVPTGMGGVWDVQIAIQGSNPTAGSIVAYLFVNGTEIANSAAYSSTSGGSAVIAGKFVFAAGDAIKARMFGSSGQVYYGTNGGARNSWMHLTRTGA